MKDDPTHKQRRIQEQTCSKKEQTDIKMCLSLQDAQSRKKTYKGTKPKHSHRDINKQHRYGFSIGKRHGKRMHIGR